MLPDPYPPRRRFASWRDLILLSFLGALFLVGWSLLPQAFLTAFDILALVPPAGLRADVDPELIPLFFGGLALLGLSLRRMGPSRMALTRPLAGAVACVVVAVCIAQVFRWLGLPLQLVPIGLAGLWVAASFGPGAGILCGLSGFSLSLLVAGPEPAAAVLLGRAALPALFVEGRHAVRTGFWSAAGAGALSGLAIGLGGLATTGKVDWVLAALLVVGGVAEGLLFGLTRGLGERLLGHVSRERLHDLLDLEQPLLQRMIDKAPGSFEHSRAMANLAEQAASSIGADALLVRVGAYYHDLGKSVEPRFFVENLHPGETNPHDDLRPLESVAHILRHVQEGVRILRQGGIPEPVVEFSYTHHGTQRIEYFLGKQRQLCAETGEDVNEAAFRYPGMRPGTKETAILMLVDSIEAASRTIDEPDRNRFEEMVRRIVFSKLSSGQLDESGLTMEELRIVCARVVQALVHMNHHRIKYPWQKEQARQFGVGDRELADGRFPRVLAGGKGA